MLDQSGLSLTLLIIGDSSTIFRLAAPATMVYNVIPVGVLVLDYPLSILQWNGIKTYVFKVFNQGFPVDQIKR